MLACVAPEHIRLCMQRHKERVQKEANRKAREARDRQNRTEEEAAVRGGSLGRDDEVEDEDGNGNGDGDAAAAAAAPGAEGKKSTVGRKRKAEGEAELAAAPPKKKTKKELEAEARLQKARLPKPKGPVDVERQCGVPLPNGGFCARSLTCKSHAMGAKRAVPGRSLPYDTLLAQYQKKNQAKQQSTFACFLFRFGSARVAVLTMAFGLLLRSQLLCTFVILLRLYSHSPSLIPQLLSQCSVRSWGR